MTTTRNDDRLDDGTREMIMSFYRRVRLEKRRLMHARRSRPGPDHLECVPLGRGDNNAGVEAGIMALVAMGATSASASRPRGLRAGSRGDAPGSHV